MGGRAIILAIGQFELLAQHDSDFILVGQLAAMHGRVQVLLDLLLFQPEQPMRQQVLSSSLHHLLAVKDGLRRWRLNLSQNVLALRAKADPLHTLLELIDCAVDFLHTDSKLLGDLRRLHEVALTHGNHLLLLFQVLSIPSVQWPFGSKNMIDEGHFLRHRHIQCMSKLVPLTQLFQPSDQPLLSLLVGFLEERRHPQIDLGDFHVFKSVRPMVPLESLMNEVDKCRIRPEGQPWQELPAIGSDIGEGEINNDTWRSHLTVRSVLGVISDGETRPVSDLPRTKVGRNLLPMKDGRHKEDLAGSNSLELCSISLWARKVSLFVLVQLLHRSIDCVSCFYIDW